MQVQAVQDTSGGGGIGRESDGIVNQSGASLSLSSGLMSSRGLYAGSMTSLSSLSFNAGTNSNASSNNNAGNSSGGEASLAQQQPILTLSQPSGSARGASTVTSLHLPPSLPGPHALSPRLWMYTHAGDARAPLASNAVTKAHATVSPSISLGLSPGALDRARDAAVLRRACAETKIYSTDATLWTLPDHLACLGSSQQPNDTPSFASFSSRISAVSNIPRNLKQRKPVDTPPALPPRKGTQAAAPREITYVAPSIPRLFVQLVDLRVKNSTQAFNVHCTIQVGTQVYFTAPLPLSQESKKGFGLVICPKEAFVFDIPEIDPPSPYPILIQIHKGPPPPQHILSSLQTGTQKPITPVAPPPKSRNHRRKKSNDSVAQSITSISSNFSTFKSSFMRGMRGGDRGSNVPGNGGEKVGGGGLESRRMTLNISSPFRGKSSAMAGVSSVPVNPAGAAGVAGGATAPQPSTQQNGAGATAPAAEPTYAIPVYYGTTITHPPRSESAMNLFHFANMPDETSPNSANDDSAGIPQTLLGQVVLLPQTTGDMKATFEKVVFMPDNGADAVAFGLSSLKIGKKTDKEVALVCVQVGRILDEGYPLVEEIPPVEYATCLNFQISSKSGGIWKKYWTVIKNGVLEVYDFEYREQKPSISSLPLQGYLQRVVRPDPEEMCAMNCVELCFAQPFADNDDESEDGGALSAKERWRQSVVESNGSVFVTADSKDGVFEIEAVLSEFI
ncbi:hypothetical protein HDU81_005019 [Chytriomyces hyalinus]|nr:hypothetical protein HDU81_005019 [Chytriomyces hyalinus]